MNLKNYTSGIHQDTTIARIERLLVDAGATGIAKEYTNGQVSALMFQIAYSPEALPMTVKLPANLEACVEFFWKEHCRTRSVHSRKTREDFIEQGTRTAWKIQQDWCEVQVSLIRLKQQEVMQAFLPYAWDGSATFYERIKSTGFRAMLPAPKAQP